MSLSNTCFTLMLTLCTFQTECTHHRGQGTSREVIPAVFSVMLSENVKVESASTPIGVVFDKIVTNVGDWFDPLTSIFNVPDDGDYFFAFNFVSGQSKFADVRLSINGEHKISAMSKSGKFLGSNQGVFTLKVGDRGFLELQPHGMIDNSDLYATFSGYRLNTTSAFTVARTTNKSAVGILPYDKIITNIGNGYDASSYKFKVSMAGIYSFIFNNIDQTIHNIIQLINNGTAVISAETAHYFTTGQNNAILSLDANADIWINNANSGLSNSTFTGYLHRKSSETKDKIAFSVARTTLMTSSSSAVRLMFDHQILNEGLGFNFAGSFFQAPLDGIYIFFFNGKAAHSGNMLLAYLYQDTKKLAAMYGNTYNAVGSNHVILRLLENENVWLDLQPNSQIHSEPEPKLYTSFSGYLLYSFN